MTAFFTGFWAWGQEHYLLLTIFAIILVMSFERMYKATIYAISGRSSPTPVADDDDDDDEEEEAAAAPRLPAPPVAPRPPTPPRAPRSPAQVGRPSPDRPTAWQRIMGDHQDPRP